MKKLQMNFKNKILNHGQGYLSPAQREEIIKTGKVVLFI